MKNKNEDALLVKAADAASGHFAREGIAHNLVGRLALRAHGYELPPSQEVTFLLDESSAFVHDGSGIVATRVSLPLSAHGVRVKWASLEEDWERDEWDKELEIPTRDGDIPIAPVALVLHVMMAANDEEGVRAAVKDKVPTAGLRGVLLARAPRLAARLDAIVDDVARTPS